MTTEYFNVRNGFSVGEDTFTVEAATGDVVVGGNLTVNGTTTTFNTTQLEIEDNIIVLNKNVTGNPTLNGGIVIERGQGTDSALTWNESTDKWEQNRGGVTTVIPVNTTELVEGTNLYHTAQRAVDAVEAAGYATETQVDLKLNTADFTTTANTWLGTKSTSNVTEGSNLYYTATRARAEIAGSNPGSFIGLTASGNIDLLDSIAVGDSTKTGYQGIEFNSNSKTATLVIDHTTGKLIYSKDAVTYTPIAQSTTELAEGTNLYYTDARVGNYLSVNSWATQEYVGVQVANLIASAPSTLNTLNELATALGNDANFATTTATALGTKLATTDFTSTANTWLGTKTTANLAENTNLYYTDTRARASNSGGTGVTYDSGTGVISIGQAVGTGDSPSFASITATGNIIKGAIRNSTTAAAGDVWNLNATGAVGPTRGITLDNSTDTTKNIGTILRTYSGSAASGQRPRLVFEKARGFPTGVSTGPAANAAADVLGGIDATGYSSTGWVNDTLSLSPGNMVFVCNEAWTSNTNLGTGFVMNLAPTATTISTAANLVQAWNMNPQLNQSRSDAFTWGLGKSATTFSATGSSISGTTLTIGTVTTGTVAVGQFVQTAILGVLTGTYIVSNISGSGSGSTWVVSQTQTVASTTITGTSGAMFLNSSGNLTLFGDLRVNGNDIQNSGGTSAITLTSANTSTTVRGDTINFNNAAGTTTYAQFASGGSSFGFVDAPVILNRTTAGTPGVLNAKASYNIESRRTDQAGVTDGDSTGAGFRVGGTGNYYWTHNQSSQYDTAGDHIFSLQAADGDRTAGAVWLNVLDVKPTQTTIYAGTASSGGGGSTSAKLTVEATKITAAVPLALPVYTASAATAITGAAGWLISISNSASGSHPNGMLAFWDTTNSRWSYIHDNSAV